MSMYIKNRYAKIALILSAAFVSSLLIIWAAAGPIAKPQVIKLLKSKGAESATIKSIIFNPFRPSLQVKGLTINAPKDSPLHLERLYVRLSWIGLFHKEIRVLKVEIQNFNLQVDQTTEEPIIGGMRLNSSKPTDGEEDNEIADKKPLEWRLCLYDLGISSSQVAVSIPDFTGTIDFDKFQIQNMILGEEYISGSIDFSGRLNKALTNLKTQIELNKGKGMIKTRFDLNKLGLAMFQPFLDKTVSGLKGDVSLQADLQADIDGDSIVLEQTAILKMADIGMETPDIILDQKQGEFNIDFSSQIENLKPQKIHIKQMGLSDTHISIGLKKNPVEKTEKKPELPPAPEKTKAPEQKPSDIAFEIDLVQVTGDTRIDFNDFNLEPVFKEQIRKLNFKITDINNKQLEKSSPFSLVAEIQKYGKFDFSGQIKPFKKDLYADIKGRISEYGLPPVSKYTNDILGYNIQTGQLNADVTLKIDKRMLDGQTSFDFKALKLIPSAKETSEQITTQVTMPLDLALGYISDDKGNLKLDVPIDGSLDDPKFGVTHLCQIVMVKAAKSAAYSYLKNMILPYGALVQFGVDVAISAGQKMMELKLAPLEYPPGQVKPGPESKAYIEQLTNLLTKEPQMRLIICGIATSADLTPEPVKKDQAQPRVKKVVKLSKAEKEKLLTKLAEQRMENFKLMLVKKHGIASSRLLDCLPKIDTEPDGKPRIEIDL